MRARTWAPSRDSWRKTGGPGRWDGGNVVPYYENDVWIEGDYHLSSQAGRWDAAVNAWVQDNVTSPCIDAGDPGTAVGWEPFPNGGLVNMGYFGGTDQASKSWFGGPVCDTPVAGDINGDCKVNLRDLALLCSHWLAGN